MKIRKKLILKIGAFVSSLALAITCISLNTHAYVLENDNIYSENGLDISNPDIDFVYTSSATSNFAPDISSPNDDTIWIGGTSYTWQHLTVRFYNSPTLSGSSYVSTITNITDLYTFGSYDLGLGNGVSSNYLRQNYSNYYLVFMSEVNVNGSYQGNAIGYKFSRILDYFDLFSSSTISYSYWYVTCRLDSYNVSLPNTLRVSHLGVFRGSSLMSSADNFEPHSTWLYNESDINQLSYNMGVVSANVQITSLRQQISSLEQQVSSLSEQLANAQNNKMQTLIWTIGSTPFESFKTIWDVNIWGLNIGGIVIGGLLALLIVYLIKKVWK